TIYSMSAHLAGVVLTASLASTLASAALAQSLSDRILVGYWHNWQSSPNSLTKGYGVGYILIVSVRNDKNVPDSVLGQYAVTVRRLVS
ncbi:MAG: hypothetical protein ACYTKC_12230, partial [Planctomycetota bacterium]